MNTVRVRTERKGWMRKNFFEQFVNHSAATLAGHKAGSLFCCAAGTGEISQQLEEIRHELSPKGVQVMELCRCEKARQVFVYRPAMIKDLLLLPKVSGFLLELGYHEVKNVEAVLAQFVSRFTNQPGFPHELGIFLGYPIEDVLSFIRHEGKNYLLNGYWKVYSRQAESQRRFYLYDKCRRVYLRSYRNGIPITRLAVA